VRNEVGSCAHEHTGEAEASGIPCVMALRLMPRSPRRRIRLVTVAGGLKVQRRGIEAVLNGRDRSEFTVNSIESLRLRDILPHAPQAPAEAAHRNS
jgi:hypothetical protein